MAEAQARVGLVAEAARSAETAVEIARAHGFHEVSYRMDGLLSRLAAAETNSAAGAPRGRARVETDAAPPRRAPAADRYPTLSTASRRVVRALETLPMGAGATGDGWCT
jgi:hypothetical protein